MIRLIVNIIKIVTFDSLIRQLDWQQGSRFARNSVKNPMGPVMTPRPRGSSDGQNAGLIIRKSLVRVQSSLQTQMKGSSL